MAGFAGTWFSDFRRVFLNELHGVLTDVGVLIIFFVGGLGYPLLYNLAYFNGVIADTPVAVVDDANCEYSRRYIQKMDATREIEVAAKCVSMEEAQELMRERKVNGIMYFPSDFGERITANETAKLSIYADMSSFLYYKNLLMASSFVMLDEIHTIEIERFSALGMTGQQISQTVAPIPYQENNPFNNAFSYTIFFLSAALMLVVQQTMFYGMSLRAGTMRENHLFFVTQMNRMRGRGMGRIVCGRGLAYWLLYMGIALYVAFIVPAIFAFPQRAEWLSVFVLLLFYVSDCVLFCEFWSSFFYKREIVIVLLLFISPVAMFLTGFSWPESAFPEVWRYFSYIFPSTFGCRAFINLNSAGGDLTTVSALLWAMTVQACIYYFLSCAAVFIENRVVTTFHLDASEKIM